MNSSSATTLLLIVFAFSNAHFISSGRQEFDAVQTAWFGISDVLNWAKSLKSLVDNNESRLDDVGRFGSNSASVALGDCVKLYEASETRLARLASEKDYYSLDDGAAWLSAALGSNRGCLDGLREKWLLFDTSLAQNLNALLQKALDSMADQGDTGVGGGVKVGNPPYPKGYSGILASWSPGSSRADLVVAKDGSGQYKTINEALNAAAKIGSNRPARTVIHVKSGVYKEQVSIDSKLTNLMFVGDGIGRTIVTGSKNAAGGGNTLNSATFGVYADGFWARDVTFANTAGPVKEQAVALGAFSDKSVFYRCSFEGYQDTLLAFHLRQFYRDCQIHGTIDYIFGDASAVFQNCEIIVRRPMRSQSNVITAQGRESSSGKTGFVIMGSRVRPDSSLAPFKGNFKTYLGRPWEKYARVVFVGSYLDDLVAPEGWKEWDGGSELSTLYFAEYKNTGKGANTAKRVKWPGFHVLQDPADVAEFSVRNFIQGHLWLPATGVPFKVDI